LDPPSYDFPRKVVFRSAGSPSAARLREAFESVGKQILETVAHVHPKRLIEVALDWTDLGEFMGLWLSLPYQGRALPLYCAVLPKESALGSMMGEEEELLRSFLGLFPDEIRQRIVILADRGFGKRELFVTIRQQAAHFAIRISRFGLAPDLPGFFSAFSPCSAVQFHLCGPARGCTPSSSGLPRRFS